MASPGNKMHWDMKPEDLVAETDKLILKSKAVYDSVASLQPDEVSYDTVLKVGPL